MIRTIIVDDEVKSIKTMELLLEPYQEHVEIVSTASNALAGIKEIVLHKPDLLFLDIQMPGYNGFELLEQVKDQVKHIVFITAHKEYAIEALRKGAFDYILKPFDSDELKNCLERILKGQGRNQPEKNARTVIELSVKTGIHYIKQEDIVFLEASGSYTEFHLDNGVRHLVSKSMKAYETQLDPELFYRCHNSYIINIQKVKQYIHTEGLFAEMSGGKKVSIARSKKDEFLEKIKGVS
jgi:two-component system LytT family response regulator